MQSSRGDTGCSSRNILSPKVQPTTRGIPQLLGKIKDLETERGDVNIEQGKQAETIAEWGRNCIMCVREGGKLGKGLNNLKNADGRRWYLGIRGNDRRLNRAIGR